MSRYLFHTTRSKTSLNKILGKGYIEPRWDKDTYTTKISLTWDPWVGETINPQGYTFVFPAERILDTYGGRDVDFPTGTRESHFGESEIEVEVPIKVSDAIEILSVRDAGRKYGAG